MLGKEMKENVGMVLPKIFKEAVGYQMIRRKSLNP